MSNSRISSLAYPRLSTESILQRSHTVDATSIFRAEYEVFSLLFEVVDSTWKAELGQGSTDASSTLHC
jgi:hypothetical protein